MFKLVLSMQKQKKYIFSLIGYLLVFSIIYFMLDYLSGGYLPMIQDYGIYLVVINVLLNIAMSFISALMFNFSTAQVSLTKRGEATGYLSFLSVLLGFFTYGCTSCMITFRGHRDLFWNLCFDDSQPAFQDSWFCYSQFGISRSKRFN